MSEYTFKLPDLGEGLVEAEIAEWMVKVGDQVEEEDAIAAMLTDKAAVELTAPVTGKVVSLAGEVGDTVAVGTPLIVFETSGEALVAEEESGATEPEPVKQPEPDSTNTQSSGVLTSPSVRRQAREAGIDLAQVKGSGPRGRILRTDLESHLQDGPEKTQTPGKGPSSGVREIKVIGLRRKIAERMTQANRDVPHFTYVEEIDITALESLRGHLNNKKTGDQEKLTLLPFFGMALARVLHDFPQCNALYDAERNVISQFEAVHLGIATQTPDGLKVPVVKHSETRSLEDLAAEIRRVSTAARDNTASREELMGSTITITSLGKAGGIVSTPVINLPEVAIIGVNRATDRPVIVDGEMVVRRMMNLSSSFDHRFVDGHDGAMMIQALKDLLEHPVTIFMP
jgi:2-oxoisovalerate dehydrogenase E2 component (dihydrolipoyl transacylase)